MINNCKKCITSTCINQGTKHIRKCSWFTGRYKEELKPKGFIFR
jgi:hypothetical protein